tara:strand:+ start:539 stop:832 length:294 start_codon:yes stop_codon:yes gene_type:complete
VQKYNLKKINIIKNLSSRTGFSESFSKKIVNDLILLIVHNIKLGSLNLKNFGTFHIVNKKERRGRNPKTKEIFLISSRKSVIFKPSKKIVNTLNKFI